MNEATLFNFCQQTFNAAQTDGWTFGGINNRPGRKEVSFTKGRYAINLIAKNDGQVFSEILTKSNTNGTYNPPRNPSSQYSGKLIDCIREADRRIDYWATQN